MSLLVWSVYIFCAISLRGIQAAEIQDFFIQGVSTTGQVYPRNVIDATNGQASIELHYAFSLDPSEKLINASVFINDEEKIQIWYNITTPVAFPPFQGFGRDMGWKYNRSGAGIIVISYPMPFLHGRYKLEVKTQNPDTQETLMTREIIYVKYFSNCTRLDGTAQIISPCTFDLKLKCAHPVFPLSNFKVLMYLTSSIDDKFVKMVPVEAVTLRERDDKRYDVNVAYQYQLSKYAPLDLIFKSELYQEDRAENAIVQPLTKGASCTGEGSTPDPTAYQFLSPVTYYPTETPFIPEQIEGTTQPRTQTEINNSPTPSSPSFTSMTGDPISEPSGSSCGTSDSLSLFLLKICALCFILAHLTTGRAQAQV